MTRGEAIHQHCKECIYDPYSPGTMRQQTGACPSKDCALWSYRPIPRSKSDDQTITSTNPPLEKEKAEIASKCSRYPCATAEGEA
jgi:hypothetical protein